MNLVETNIMGWFQNETLHSWLANIDQGGMAYDSVGLGLEIFGWNWSRFKGFKTPLIALM